MTIIYENGSGGFGTLDGLSVGDSLSASVGRPPFGASGFPGDPSDEVLLNLEPGATYTFTLNWSGTANFIGLTFVDGANPEDILLTGGVERERLVDGNGNPTFVPVPPSSGPAAKSDPILLTFTVPESGQVHVTIVGSGYQWETSAPNSTKGITYDLALTEIIPPEPITEPNMSIADLRITEVHYNPEDGTPPFLEITNTGTEAVSAGDFFVGNSDYGPQYYDVAGINATLAPSIPAGATLILVPSIPNTTGEVYVPPVPISQEDFEAAYGELPEGTVYYNYPAFLFGSDSSPYYSDAGYTIGGMDIFGDSVYIPSGAALGESAQVDGEGNVTFGAPTPGSTGAAPPPTGPTEGDDTLAGTDGADTIDGLGGRDTIDGGMGDDDLFGGAGNDAIDGGQDNDTITLGDGNDNAWGGEGDDDLFGGTGLDRLNGNSGDDEIYGGKGGDIIQGGKGEDYIEGGAQSDIISGGEQSDEIYGGTGDDTITGDEGADLIYGGSGRDVIDGGSFDDIIYGDHGFDKIRGGAGDDLIFGGVSTDRLNGNSGDDEIYGGRGNDNIKGGSGDDDLYGGAQGDRLDGGNGNDLLNGGLGDDLLTGGAGADVFVFEGTINFDVITDFEVGVDKIDVTAYGPVTIEQVTNALSQVGDDVVVDLKGKGDITLQNVSLDDLSFDDLIFIPDDILVVG